METLTNQGNAVLKLSVKDLSDTLQQKFDYVSQLEDIQSQDNFEDYMKVHIIMRRLDSLLQRERILRDRAINTFIDNTGIDFISVDETNTLINRYVKQYENSLKTFIRGINMEEYHRAMALAGEPANKDIINLFSKGLELYWQRRWDDAIEIFNKANELDKDDMPTQLMIDRLNAYKLNPPHDNWQGEFIQTKK